MNVELKDSIKLIFYKLLFQFYFNSLKKCLNSLEIYSSKRNIELI